MVNGWFGILGVPKSKAPLHEGIQGIQTTNPNHQFTFLVDGFVLLYMMYMYICHTWSIWWMLNWCPNELVSWGWFSLVLTALFVCLLVCLVACLFVWLVACLLACLLVFCYKIKWVKSIQYTCWQITFCLASGWRKPQNYISSKAFGTSYFCYPKSETGVVISWCFVCRLRGIQTCRTKSHCTCQSWICIRWYGGFQK